MDNIVEPKETRHDALSGKIMLIAIVILFIVIIIMLCLHVYIRWYLVRARRPQLLNRPRLSHSRSRRGPQFVFFVNPATLMLTSRGLHASVISSLPVFAFSAKTHTEAVECAVCLSEFKDGETGRVLPRCDHSFHIDCIDMWFQSHSTCPICRAPVKPSPETRPEATITVCEPESGSSSAGCCQYEGEEPNRTEPAVSSSSSSTGFAEKRSTLVGVTVEAHGRNESFGGESQSSSRSPMSRMMSFKRILSRERKARVSQSEETQ